jgi:NAD(P)-dependent dehydrogenase (short-subunit alcohol dehydrogenase family)
MTRNELDGRAAIVTGAGAGIGEAGVRALAFSGAPVLVVDLDDERAERVAAISDEGATALASDDASCITGSYHLVDGGYTAR